MTRASDCWISIESCAHSDNILVIASEEASLPIMVSNFRQLQELDVRVYQRGKIHGSAEIVEVKQLATS
jgi:hypothetical protein